jgi:hypothetical protein
MTKTRGILDYAPNPALPRELTLEEGDGCVRVIFGVAPAWAYWLRVIFGAAYGTLSFAMGVFVAIAAWRLFNQIGAPVLAEWRLIRFDILAAGAGASLFWAMAAHELWKYRRWGRVPRVLTASDSGLLLSWLGTWRMRQRVWPANEIAAVELRPVKRHVFARRTVGHLYICRHSRRRLHFRLSSHNSQLPGEIAKRLASKLGCAVTIKE